LIHPIVVSRGSKSI